GGHAAGDGFLHFLDRAAQLGAHAHVGAAQLDRLLGALGGLLGVGHGGLSPKGKRVSGTSDEACYDTPLVHTKQSPRLNLLRAAASVSGMTLASRITGFIRDTLLAILFGAGLAMDAFVVAFRIPNLLRRLFAEGAFSQAFVPVLGEYRERRGEDATRELAGKVLAVLAFWLFVVTLIGVVAAPV